MTEKMSFGIDIDKELIEKNVTAMVAHAIADALGDKEKLVNDAVAKILQSYVKKDGTPCSPNDWNKTPYIQYLANKCVEDTIREELQKAVEENKDAFRDVIRKELTRKKRQNQIGAAFIDAILTSAKSEWRTPITVSFEPPKEDY